jgi:hypothetical protein
MTPTVTPGLLVTTSCTFQRLFASAAGTSSLKVTPDSPRSAKSALTAGNAAIVTSRAAT